MTDHRGARRRRDTASGAGGVHRARRDAVRLLHAGHGDELRGAASSAIPTRPPRTSRRAISGHLCRCGTYPHVVAATLAAAQGAEGLRHGQRRRDADRDDSRSGSSASGSARVERRVPADEPPPLPPNAELSGDRQARAARRTGAPRSRARPATRSTSRCPACCTRASCARRMPHAEVRAIDTAAGRSALRGVRGDPARSSSPTILRARRRALCRRAGRRRRRDIDGGGRGGARA